MPVMQTPVLYVFAISHYCEKARWALEYLGIEYTLKFLPVGVHTSVAKKFGLPQSALPFLQLDERIIQGSSNIIDWAEQHRADASQSLSATSDLEASRKLEARLDDLLGVHIRRYFYSEALVEFPRTVLPVFTRDLPLWQRLITTAGWGVIRKIMITRMDLGYEQGMESRALIVNELDWLDETLADGRQFLCGEALSRVDITAASLIAPLVQPAKHPTYTAMEIPPRARVDCQAWRTRPSLQWVTQLYEHYR
ncbi:MAG: glutathione S-transferase N-terminal domain-containing protein [Proteobacteria bacterium]|nr:glutathione S-transferase N-terminal domain-containing protein [Pseudomonadota bacterium]